jgi:hypothetical protein
MKLEPARTASAAWRQIEMSGSWLKTDTQIVPELDIRHEKQATLRHPIDPFGQA